MIRQTELVKLLLHALSYTHGETVLRVVARGLLIEGLRREELVGALEQVRRALQAEAREDDEDLVLDVLDAMHNWTRPGKSF